MEPDDAELLRRHLADPNSDAFAQLVARHIDRIYGVALRQVGGDTHLAQDVTQRVFADLARKAPSLADRPTLGGWLYRSTQFAGSEVVRTERRRRAREQEAYAMQDIHDDNDPQASISWNALGPVLDEVMAGLNDRDRDAVAMRFFENRAFVAIGAALHTSEDAARMRVDRALEKMRTLLARRGITCTAAALGGVLAAPGLVAAPSGLAASITTSALTASAGAVAGVGAGTVVHLMSSTKLVTGLAAAIVVLAVGTATYETRTYATPVVVTTPVDGPASAELSAIEAKTIAVVAETEAIRAELTTLRTMRAQAMARLAVPQRSTDVAAEELGRAFMERHPEVRQALHEWTDAKTRLDYGALFRQLQLTPAQIDAFLALKRTTGRVSGSWGPNDATMTLRAEGADSTNDIKSILGDEAFAVYRDYERTKMERRASMMAASYLSFTDEPLTTVQTDELTRILQESRLRQRPGTGAENYDWDRVMAEASGIFTESQRPVLEALRADDCHRAALSRSMP
ncbi:MAG: sigma-70 family RNA polymerase sigma factor [Opitutaceae bacterium]|nr:sigma-70 family RNA polymerase sigma factor [Opitutaceae bacterium]